MNKWYKCVECLQKPVFPIPMVADMSDDVGLVFRAACPNCGGQISLFIEKGDKDD